MICFDEVSATSEDLVRAAECDVELIVSESFDKEDTGDVVDLLSAVMVEAE